jgi:hypothetical protein
MGNHRKINSAQVVRFGSGKFTSSHMITYASIKFSKSKSSSGTEHHQRDHTNYYPPSVEERANLRSTDYMDTNPDHNDVISEIQ